MADISSTNNSQIAKNALLLYIRMLVTMGVGLYTSRVVINILGVSDYGIYSVVGGIVLMVAFLNTSMASASQRFIAYELGIGNFPRLTRVFQTSIATHLLVALVLFIIAETVGLWFLNSHLNIDISRIKAANWVYQCSVLTFMLSVVSVPYNACIIAHEHMKAFAYISIIEVGLKLAVVYLLQIVISDKLITYAILTLIVAVVIRLTYSVYCKHYFAECRSRLSFDRKLFRDMFAFVGWNILGTSSLAVKEYGVNVLLNLFGNTILNAARGIAMQVNGVVLSFTDNFIMAIRPQIVKQYAAGNKEESKRIVCAGCKYAAYLMLLIIIPLMLNMDYILHLWLGIVPAYTAIFLRIVLVASFFRATQLPLVSAIHATGNIRRSQVMISIVNYSEFLLAWVILKNGVEPYIAVCPSIITAFINTISYFFCLRRLVPVYDVKQFMRVILKVIFVALGCYLLCWLISSYFIKENLISLLATSALSLVITITVIYSVGMSSKERSVINKKVKEIYTRIVTLN